MKITVALLLLLVPCVANADIVRIELTPTDVGSSDSSFFSDFPASNHTLFFGPGIAGVSRSVNFNTAPDGPLVEGGVVNTQYASLGVTMNDIRISGAIYGGNNYGTGFAAEHDSPQIYTFSIPVVAVGIVNTSPDKDLIEFFSGPNATGTLLDSFTDQEAQPTNFNIDRFLGGTADSGVTIGSIRLSNASGNLELDELIFVQAVPEPSALLLLTMAGLAQIVIRRRE